MTINKSQGQSLKNVGLYLPKQVFRHGQLYVALSRVTNKNGLKVLTFEDDYPEGNVAKKYCLQGDLLIQKYIFQFI
jgi:hypothetical protein